METGKRTIKVWDPLLRVGHWLLVAAFFTAYFTEDERLTWHVWAGYTVGAIVLVRLLWGIIGPKPARFAQFVRAPAAAIRYLRDLPRGRSGHFIGHNPAGGWMTVLLLAGLTVTVSSGLVLYAQEEGAGPLAPLFTAGISVPLPIAAALADDDDREYGDRRERRRDREHDGSHEAWEEIHEIGANATLALIIVHVLGVIASSIAHRENLARSMVTGRKTFAADESPADPELLDDR